MNVALASFFNPFLEQYFSIQLSEETFWLVLMGMVFVLILGLGWLVRGKFQARPSREKAPLSEKASEKKFAQLEKIHLKQQKQEEKQRKAAEKQKESVQLAKIREEEKRIQEALATQEAQQRQTLQKDFHAQETVLEPANFLDRLKQGMEKTRSSLIEGVSGLALGKNEIDEELLDELEEMLIVADIGPETTRRILHAIQQKVERTQRKDPRALREMLQSEIMEIMEKTYPVPTADHQKPFVLLMVGVNGVGKTTTIGKIAAQYRQKNKRVLVGAGDTFRAAAIEQLAAWSERADCDIVAKEAGSDPSSVLYETIQKAVNDDYDVVICDTAGRLHTKKNLMEELKKMVRVIQKVIPEAPHEVLLVLDATTGQNAIFQVREFSEIAPLTGLVVTKLDGTAKGGVVIGIVNEFDIPVRYIGVGEGIDDLRPFQAEEFAQSLFQ